jgi:hypothetical protein
MKPRILKYKHWQTGEEHNYVLSERSPTENLTKLICPLDNTLIIFAYDGQSKGKYCANCGTEYGNFGFDARTQEDVSNEIQYLSRQFKYKLQDQTKKVIDLAQKIALIENDKLKQSLPK